MRRSRRRRSAEVAGEAGEAGIKYRLGAGKVIIHVDACPGYT
jgi:hypothetical protein